MLTDVRPEADRITQPQGRRRVAIQQMQSWGMKNGRLEPWDFRVRVDEQAPRGLHRFRPSRTRWSPKKSWTPGTKGAVRGNAVKITLPRKPTKEELATYLESLKESTKGMIVLVNAPVNVPVTFNPCRSGDVRIATLSRKCPTSRRQAGRGGGPAGQPGQPQDPAQPDGR